MAGQNLVAMSLYKQKKGPSKFKKSCVLEGYL